VIRLTKMLSSVPVIRFIAAANMAACAAHTQVNPGIAHSDTLGAAFAIRRNLFNLVKMGTLFQFFPLANSIFGYRHVEYKEHSLLLACELCYLGGLTAL